MQNNTMSYENVLYFAISRDLDDKDQVYGKNELYE